MDSCVRCGDARCACAQGRCCCRHAACALEFTQCPRCGDALRVLAFITDLHVTAHILEHLGLTSDVVPIALARAPPDDPVSELEFGA